MLENRNQRRLPAFLPALRPVSPGDSVTQRTIRFLNSAEKAADRVHRGQVNADCNWRLSVSEFRNQSMCQESLSGQATRDGPAWHFWLHDLVATREGELGLMSEDKP